MTVKRPSGDPAALYVSPDKSSRHKRQEFVLKKLKTILLVDDASLRIRLETRSIDEFCLLGKDVPILRVDCPARGVDNLRWNEEGITRLGLSKANLSSSLLERIQTTSAASRATWSL